MLRRNGQRLCKLAACVVALVIACYTFGKCEHFLIPALMKKLDGFTEHFDKIIPQLNAMLQYRLNYTAEVQELGNRDLKLDDESYSKMENSKRPGQIPIERGTYEEIQNQSGSNVPNKPQLQKSGNELPTAQPADFIKVFAELAEKQHLEAERRQTRFEMILTNLTRTLVKFNEKRKEGNFRHEINKNKYKVAGINGYIKHSEETAVSFVDKSTDSSKKESLKSSSVFTEQPSTTPSNQITFKISDKENVNTGKLTTTKDTTMLEGIGLTVNISTKILPKSQSAILNEAPHANAELTNDSTAKHSDMNAVKSSPKTKYSTSGKQHLAYSTEKINAFTPSYNVSIPKTNTISENTKSSENKAETTIPNLKILKPTKRLMSQTSLDRRAQVFLRKMKNFGISYNERVFYYKVKEQQNNGIFYRDVSPVSTVENKLTIFLLHDSHYDSKTWLGIGTLYALGTHGYRVIALDLPGHGNSKNVSEPASSIDKLRLLVSFMLALTPKGPRALVSPGESGLYSVPMVMKASVILKGVIFVSTAYTGKYPSSRYEKVHIPALVIHGENDDAGVLDEFLGSMKRLPDSKRIYSIKKAGHDCYIENPNVFHEFLTEFLLQITRGEKTRKLENKDQK